MAFYSGLRIPRANRGTLRAFDAAGAVVATEIRGTPPKLYVERIGDDPEVLRRGNIALTGGVAAVWREFA